MNSIVTLIFVIGSVSCGGNNPLNNRVFSYIGFESYDSCEGPDAANYTNLQLMTSAASCYDQSQIQSDPLQYLISCDRSSRSIVNTLITLQRSAVDVDAYRQLETLSLVVSGNLQGKYILFNERITWKSQLSRCVSSNPVFGNHVVSNPINLLIADKLPLNALLGSDSIKDFKQAAKTSCSGNQFII